MMRKLYILLLITAHSLNAQTISTTKPWSYWWWMGSAVTRDDIKSQLGYFSKAGLGGVHIIPIYGVKGFETKSIDFLSDDWLAMLDYTIIEGRKLGLGVDMSTGTGWPFGGPNVSRESGARQMTVNEGVFEVVPTKQQVKRAAPGGAGSVLDPFLAGGMKGYLSRFDSAFAGKAILPRSMYMDSYEAYGANWTLDFESEFAKRRGYEIKDRIFELSDTSGKADGILVKIDYHQTLSELLRERYARVWTQWSKQKGFLTRYQAHGSPGNLLDLYDEADIPETESFGTSRFAIPGLRVDPDYSITQFGTPNVLAMKFASSAAHFSGKKWVSSETGTWLANHFKVSLSQIKPQIDELFVAGINHIFYHGITYSPPSEPYPGWLFYASTHFGPTSHFAEHFSLLNKYVEKCQALLQNSSPDNDVLVYFPIHDLWSSPSKSSGGVHLLEVHHVDRWLLGLPFGRLTQQLWHDGFGFDYVSDRQLTRLKADQNGQLNSGGARYKVLVIPSSHFMPEETVIELQRLASEGAKIVFEGHSPQQVTGFGDSERRQREFLRRIQELKKLPHVKSETDINSFLIVSGARREELADKGLSFIRKKQKDGTSLYFVSNLADQFTSGWVRVGSGLHVEKMDPLGGAAPLPFRENRGHIEVYLTLLPGQSCFLKSISKPAKSILLAKEAKEFLVKESWEISFIKGKPSISQADNMNVLGSWTGLSDSAAYFSGTARYTTVFDAPSDLVGNSQITLDLGDVREVAVVRINGQSVGTAWSIPFQLPLTNGLLKSKGNILEIDVTNLSANYMRLRDQQTPDWKKFYDINIVDITYRKFDALSWQPMASGLLGPVKILYE
jgi:hypothetical protein